MTPSGFPFRLVSLDLDGTLTAVHGWRFLARELGKEPEYERANALFFSGERSEDEHLRTLLGLAEGVPIARIEEILERTPKISGITQAVRTLRDRGVLPVLLTHNPGYVCEWYARRFGFVDWDGTTDRTAPEVVGGVVRGPGGIRADKPRGLARLLDRHGLEAGQAAHAGDGRADAEIFPRVGFGIAVNSPLPDVERAADVALRITDLRRLVARLAEATPRNPTRSVL